MAAVIEDIAYALPETVLTNEDLKRRNPTWDMDRVAARTGVLRRYVAAPGQTAMDLGLEACESLFAARPELRENVDAIVFCTESADYVVPPNACVVLGTLNLPEYVLAFDVDLGCSGYPYCLGLARGMLSSGMAAHVLLINADTYSKFMHEEDQSARVLFGDGAAASWITSSPDAQGIIDVACCTAGRYYDKFIVPGGGCRNPHGQTAPKGGSDAANAQRPAETIQMDGMGILAFVNAKVPAHIAGLLERNGLGVEDVDLFVFHQASQMVLDSLPRLLKIDAGRTYSNLREVGNTVSASIPIALKDAVAAGRLARGDKVVLCGFGLGLSWGSVLLEWW